LAIVDAACASAVDSTYENGTTGATSAHSFRNELSVRHSRLALVLAVSLSPGAAFAQGLAIAHDPVGCVVAGNLPEIGARIDPAGSVAEARVLFRPRGGAHWYTVRMAAGASGFRALLPRPTRELPGFEYYLEATGAGMSTVRTEEYSPVVSADLGACAGRRVATSASAGTVALQAPAGAPPIPAGFSATGVVPAAGAGAAAAGAAAGPAAGTAAAAGGGGASTALLIAGGVVVAGGAAAAVVATRGDDSETIIRGFVYLGECTCAANRPPPYPWLTVGPIAGAVISTEAGPATATTDGSGRFELRYATPDGGPDSFRAQATAPGCTSSSWQASSGDNDRDIHLTLTCAGGPPLAQTCRCES
jgi:hypothetical protein